GFFQNVAKTRRQGVEVGLQGRWKRLGYFLSYAFVDATYQSSETLASVTDPSGVRVRSGDHIPGIPAQNVKVGAEVAVLRDAFADPIAVERFVAPGAPISGWGGVRVRF